MLSPFYLKLVEACYLVSGMLIIFAYIILYIFLCVHFFIFTYMCKQMEYVCVYEI